MGNINFNRNLTLGKEEVERWRDFEISRIKSLIGKDLFRSNLIMYHENNDAFKPSITSTTITLGEGRFIDTDSNYVIADIPDSKNLTMIDPGSYPTTEYIAITPSENNGQELESTCSITASSNQLTITGNAGNYLRDMSGTDFTKIKFLESDGSTPSNNEVYDVVEKVDANNFIISGDLADESDLKIIVIGTYDLSKVSPTDNLYTFADYSIAQYSTLALAEAAGIPICSITWTDTTTVTVADDYRTWYSYLNGKAAYSSSTITWDEVGGALEIPVPNFDVIWKVSSSSPAEETSFIGLNIPDADYSKYRGRILTLQMESGLLLSSEGGTNKGSIVGDALSDSLASGDIVRFILNDSDQWRYLGKTQ